MGWIDEISAARDAGEPQASDATAPASHPPVDDNDGRKPWKKEKKPLNKKAVIGGALLFTAIALLVTTRSLGPFASDDDKSSPAPATSSVSSAAATTRTADASIIGSCAPGARPVAQNLSLTHTVESFENAYYSRDVAGVQKLLGTDSPLRAQKWDELLPENAPEGTKWCAMVSATPDPSIAIAVVTVQMPGEPMKIYSSQALGVQQDNQWLIDRFVTMKAEVPEPGVPGAGETETEE